MNPQYPGQGNQNQPPTSPYSAPPAPIIQGTPIQQPQLPIGLPSAGGFQNPAYNSAWQAAPQGQFPQKKRRLNLAIASSVLFLGLTIAGVTTFALTRKEGLRPVVSSENPTENQSKGEAQSSSSILTELAASQNLDDAQAIINKYSQQHSIEFSTSSNDAKIMPAIEGESLTEADLPRLKQGGKVFIEEFAKYPSSWINAVGVKKIVMVNRLGYDGTRVAGLAGIGYDTFLLDIVSLSATNTSKYNFEDFARSTIHHEFFHMADWAFGTYDSQDWAALNDSSFVYDQDDPNAQVVESYDDRESPGFVSGYARQNSIEDKAETYSFLVSPGLYTRLKARMPGDPILAKKVEYLKKLILEHAPEMDDAYFEKLVSYRATPNKPLNIPTNAEELLDIVTSKRPDLHPVVTY